MAGRFLSLFGPISRFLPEVNSPTRKVGFNEKLFWTAIALVIYLVMSEISLFNVGGGGLQLESLRIIFASNRGSLTELGIGPIVTGGLILQLLIGSSIVSADLSNPEDRSLFTAAAKVFSIVLTGVQAAAYVISGMYGPLNPINSVIVFAQLLCAGVVLILLDEMLQKGWGIGSGISLFILAGVAQTIMWSCFSPVGPMGDGKHYGAFIALGESLLGGESIVNGVFRFNPDGTLTTFPSMLGFLTTVVVFVIVIYLEGVRVELPISHANYRGFRGKYPVKLLYVSNLPVIFASALFANVYVFAQLLQSQFPNNFWVNLLGSFGGEEGTTLTGGLAYYVTAPNGIAQVIADPVRALVFVGAMVTFALIFSLTWLEVGGLGPSTVAQQLVDSGMQIPGFRRSGRSIEIILKRYIPVVTVLGGAIIGLIAAVSGFFGVFGTGTGILLAVGILYQYYQLLVQEQVAEMYPALGRVLGG